MAKEAACKWTLKVSYHNEVRRLRDWPGDEAVSFDNFKQSVLSLFELEDVGQSLRYLAEDGKDGQECFLTSETLHAALEAAIAANAGLLRVTIVAKEDDATAEVPQGSADSSAEIAPDPNLHAAAPGRSEPEVEATQAATEPGATGQQDGNSYYEGWNRFKEQVVTDFRSNYQDMRGAVARDDEANRGRQVAGHVAGLTAGVCASARLIPLHGTKLAARSIAAAANFQTESESQESQRVEPVPAPNGEIDRFKQQVFQDFETGRSEIQSAFGYFVGSERENTETARPRIGRDVIPAVASTLAGLTVATTLVPLRATRLALASLARSDAPGSEPQADGVNQREGQTSS